jgi:hypothetical protein
MSESTHSYRGTEVVELADELDPIEYCYEQGWTDGLPVVPPTPERVAAAVAATGRAPGEVVCSYAERAREVTLQSVAVNAVMAGCRPAYTPVVVAIVEAMAKWRGLHSVNATTSGAALGFIVNGPIRSSLGMNSRGNVMGPGNRANSTIGRAIRLIQINAFGSIPGAGSEADLTGTGAPILDRAAVGQPAKYAGFHIVENEEDYPSLRPLHVELGYAPDQSVVTVFASLGNVQYWLDREATSQGVVNSLSRYLANSGRMVRSGWCVLVIPPEKAEIFVREGWTKADIRHAIFQATKRSVAWVKRNGGTMAGGLQEREQLSAELSPADEEAEAAIAGSPDDILVVMAGGPAGSFVHALFSYGSLPVTSQEIRLPKEDA